MATEHFKFEIGQPDEGMRLDKFLVEKFGDKFSRTLIQKFISKGDVSINGAQEKSRHYSVTPGQIIEVTASETRVAALMPEDIALDIVYEDDAVLVVNKPEGMVVHPAPGNYSGTLVNALLAHCKNLSGVGGDVKPGIVHRIDKGTSGLLVVAKTDQAHRFLSKQFKNKTSKRVYIAVVKGIVQLDNGIIDLPIGRSTHDHRKMAVKFDSERQAVTMYRVLERYKDMTLIELTLGTGRTHQIRVHMAHIGHPVVGDIQYGGKGIHLPRPALHAKMIGFTHPVTRKYVEFTAELPSDMKELIEKCRKMV